MRQTTLPASGLGAVVVLFGLLAFAGHTNEFLAQWVVAPGSAAELGIAPDCRADELQEENLSLLECELLVSNVQMQRVSSPDWFRPVQLWLSGLGSLVALASLPIGFAFVHARARVIQWGILCFGVLLALDVTGLVAAAGTGPLLRARYLWPLVLWSAIHLCLLLAVWHVANGIRHAQPQ